MLIRFAFLRRLDEKSWALGITAIFAVLNVVIFISLGSESKSHSALALVAFASYAILRIGSKKQAKSDSVT